jgi:alginate O-acetyltransferase complex protein AlgI
MVFSSFIFLFWFLPLFLAVYYLPLPRLVRNGWLTIASFVFYAWWRPHYIFLMLGSTVFDWFSGRMMGPADSGRPRKLFVVFSITANICLLGYFKYANLVVDSLNELSLAFRGVPAVDWTRVLLPVGISFYTFQSMSYTIDVYRGQVKPVRSLLDVLCYVTMFPQLVAGPIVRYAHVPTQVRNRTHTFRKYSNGVFLIAIGFVKKVLIADQAAPLVGAAFALPEPGFWQSWTGVIAYAVEIYFDFSGYSDIAIGLGLMIGFRFPINFDSPYLSRSITEFWRRWHISLSTWLRDYLYVPLGGNRSGAARTYVNLALTMLLGGLWHGAQWTYLIWGGWQGLFLIVERASGRKAPYASLPPVLQTAITFVIVLGGWVVFRAENMHQLVTMWSGMVGLHGFGDALELRYLTSMAYAATACGLLVAFTMTRSDLVVQRFQPLVMIGIILLFVVALAHLLATDYSPFLYFQF